MPVRELADRITKELLQEGFVVQRYIAHTTNSIYLKLDYGVCNSIRISDHSGKRHLKYRYNIGPHIAQYREEKRDRLPMFFYPDKCWKDLVKRALREKDLMVNSWGINGYRKIMQLNVAKNNDKMGFWREAKIIKLEDLK